MKNILLLSVLTILVCSPALSQRGTIEPPAIKNRVIKVEFFSPMYGTLNFDYEQYLKSNINLTAGIGAIGIGFNVLATENRGINLRSGVRLYFSPDYYEDDTKRYSDFQGWYFNPEIDLSFFRGPVQIDLYNASFENGNNASGALLLNIGKQWAIANVVSLDFWTGLGYNFNFSEESKSFIWKFNYLGGQGGIPLAFGFGFSVGILAK